jgi:hypothetical protein
MRKPYQLVRREAPRGARCGCLIVHRIEIAPDAGPQVGIGCKMINLTAIPHCIPDFLRVPNISTRELNSIKREMAYIRSGLLQNPHRRELMRRMRAIRSVPGIAMS